MQWWDCDRRTDSGGFNEVCLCSRAETVLRDMEESVLSLTTEKREGKGVSCPGSLEIAKMPLSPEPSTAQGSPVHDTGRCFWASPLFLLFLSSLW